MTGQLSGGDLSRLRELNALTAVRALRQSAPLTLTELSQSTGLSRPSTDDVVRDLLSRGWVQAVDPVAGAMGRPARRYRFRAEVGHVLGMDIGGHKVLGLVADLSGEIRHSARLPVDIAAGRAERLTVVHAVIEQCLEGAGLTRDDIWYAGAATTGLVDAEGRVTLSVAVPEWTGVRLGEEVGRTAGCRVIVENDSKLAALAESWQGVARDTQDVVYLLAGLRTGAGLIIGGKLHRGFANTAGEIGALPAVRWIRAQEHLQAWAAGLPEQAPSDETVGQVFAAARSGDRRAATAIRRYVKDLATGAAALVLALDPELVVLGGGFSRSADLLLDPLRRELDRLCIRTPQVLASALGDESVALGGVRMALDLLEQHIFDPNHGLSAPSAPTP